MAKARKTVDTDDLTVVVTKTLFGYASRFSLVRDYGTRRAKTIVKSENNPDHFQAYTEALDLADRMNIKLWEEK